MLVINLKDTEGVAQTLSIKAKHPLVKTMVNGYSYRLGHLVDLAENGKLSQDDLAESPALEKMSQAAAIEMVENMVRDESPYLSVVIAEAESKAKPKAKADEKADKKAEAKAEPSAEAETEDVAN